MATWNTDNPKVGNTIAADIPDIEENLQELHDVIEAITNGTLGTTTAANFKVDVLADGADCGDTPVITTGISDGTQDIDFPTNNMSACKFMTGDSNTITWMYLNTAPPGWKALSTGADKMVGIVGGAGAYAVDGGNVAGTSFDDIEAHTHTGPSHTHTMGTHNHQWYNDNGASGNDQTYDSGGTAQEINTGAQKSSPRYYFSLSNSISTANCADGYTTKVDPGDTAAGGTGNTGASSVTEARPTAALGKLFQFDTA